MTPVKGGSTTRHQRIELREALPRCGGMRFVSKPGKNVAIVVPAKPISTRHDSIGRRANCGVLAGTGDIRRTELSTPQTFIPRMTA
jgi:hypothetical protein